jgi:hypothetical protein
MKNTIFFLHPMIIKLVHLDFNKKIMKYIYTLLFCFLCIHLGNGQSRKSLMYSPKIIIQEQKIWFYDYENPNIANIRVFIMGKQGTSASQYDGLLFNSQAHSFVNTTISWDVDATGIYGLSDLGLNYDPAFCRGASGMLLKIDHTMLNVWLKGNKRAEDFDYWAADKKSFFASLPLTTYFIQKYRDVALEKWKHSIYVPPFKDIADSVIDNTYFDFFKLKAEDSTAFFALCEGNVLSTWHFDRSKQQKLWEYPFQPTGYFHVLEHRNQPYLISAEGSVFKLGRRLKKVQQLPHPLKEGWLIVDKDQDKIYFLEQKYFSFADKPRAISEILKNAFVVF